MLVRISPPMTGPPGCSSCGRTSPSRAMSSTGTTTWSSSGLRAPASTIATSRPSPIPPRNRAIVSSGRWVALRPIRWSGRGCSPSGAAVARSRSRRSRVSARCAPRFVPGDGVDLVDDHLLDAAQDLARLAREQEVQALGRRDEDVRRVADEVAPLVRGRVAGPAGDRDPRRLLAQPLRRERDAGERRAEVALDVVGQRLQRRDVEGADGAGCGLRGRAGSARGRAGRGTTGTRRGSCRCRSGRGSACARRG